VEEEHQRELAQLGEQVKASLRREREEKKRLQSENAELQQRLGQLDAQLAGTF
jgi:hypothetical protein